jgi:hypothetical protein
LIQSKAKKNRVFHGVPLINSYHWLLAKKKCLTKVSDFYITLLTQSQAFKTAFFRRAANQQLSLTACEKKKNV